MFALYEFLKTTDFYKQLKNRLERDEVIELSDTFDGLNAVLIHMIKTMTSQDILIVHHNLYHAQKLYNHLTKAMPDTLMFPQDEFITTEMLAMSDDLKYERLYAIEQLLESKQHTVITHPTGYIKYMLPKKMYANSKKTYTIGDDIHITPFVQKLIQFGYKKVDVVEEIGDFSIRGSLIDIFLTDLEHPIRIDLFDTEIESIRTFNVNTQRSIKKIQTFSLFPRTEFFYDETMYKTIKSNVKKHMSSLELDDETTKRVSNELTQLENYESLDQLSRYMRFMDTPLETISDYLNKPLVIHIKDNKIKQSYDTIVHDLTEWVMDMNDYPKMDFAFIKDLNRIYHDKKIILNDLESLHNEKDAIRVRAKHTPFYENNFHQLLNDLKKYDHYTTVLITIENEKRFEAFYDQLEGSIDIKRLGRNDTLFPNRINIVRGESHNAFEWFDTNLIVLNESAIYQETEQKKPKYKSVFKDTKKISHVKQLEKGDHIVHYDHGIGRFLEIKTMDLSGHINDYIVIQYRGDDTLYIPVENIHLLQKYVAHEGIHPKLNKLGSAEWAKTKSRVRKKAKDIAANLIKLYAEREQIKGFAFSEDNDLTDIFEADFLYEETEDQQRAIDDVKRDMESIKPMDRLICGDVGYGKTEVALRAAFKAALDNKQTAYLAPTTVLARQHYYTFKDRLEKHGITCALLNRFVTKANQTKVLKKLKTGEIDVVLGTHRLLSKDIVFKDLGLLIIDEEQRFGVEHKEKIKQLKTHVDVLSLSATPIPRTLQMAMTGVKQMSLLETPPKNRLPIQTYVLQRNDHVIKDAIERELARGGQVFYLYNRVDTIAHVKASLERLIPDANIGYAHGKMSRLKLEQMIEDFLDHKYDVLVSTTIIETGIDIPNANTLVIHDADKLGLSQLYQIRGRVGRSNRIAYSYLMYDKNKQLKEEAVKRLQVIKEFTELGSGYKIAMRDLAIRGAGDILGTEQSGFIDSVGIDLFLEMLKQEIDKERDKDKPTIQAKESAKQTIKFDVDKTIPNTYINNDDLKLELHKRISALESSNDYLLLNEELEDRFGEVPIKLMHYMQEKLYENLAITKGIERVLEKPKTITFTFSERASSEINGERLFSKVDELSAYIHLSYKKNKIIIELEKHKLEHYFLTYIITLLEAM